VDTGKAEFIVKAYDLTHNRKVARWSQYLRRCNQSIGPLGVEDDLDIVNGPRNVV
jgi:hypothetical protein